jgi:PAS domain S-box-containing protein
MQRPQRSVAPENRDQQRLMLLVRAGEIFHRSLDVDATLSNVAHLAVEWFADLCIFDLIDETSERLYVSSVAHRDRTREEHLQSAASVLHRAEFGVHPVVKVSRTGAPFFVPRMDDDTYALHAASREHERYMRELGYRSKIVVPVTAQGVIFGALTFVSTTPRKHFDQTDLEFALELGRRAGLAVSNAKQYEARKSIEDALRDRERLLADSERRFRVLAEAIPVICWTADASGWIDWYNHRWYEYTGQTSDDAAGWGWQAAHHPDDFFEVMRRWPESIASGEPFEMEYRLRRYDGEYHWFLARAEPLRADDGSIIRWYGSNADIDAQRTALERTKRIAATLQDVFLPKDLPQRPRLRLDAHYIPAEQDALVGGDWFDAFDLPDGRIGFSIGDVGGHGLDASVAVGRIRQAILTLAYEGYGPARILRDLDRILAHQEPELLVTAIVGFVDSSQESIVYANAGHPPPLVATRNDEPAEAAAYGQPPLGSGYRGEFETSTLRVDPDTTVAFYTDGMTEFSRNVLEAESRLRSTISLFVGNATVAHPAAAAAEIVFDGAAPKDDVALLMMQFSSVDVTVAPSSGPRLERMWRFHSSDAYTAQRSRREIVNYLRVLAADSTQLFPAELIIGEALANTVEHAPGLVEVHLDWRERAPVLFIRDAGPGLREFAGNLPANPLSENGRGLFLIRSFARDVSLRPLPGYGTELRIVLPIERRQWMPA